ncbi:hypothetical protein FHY18_002904 [Xanthomonas arboricola]|nr:hypothetical protein [Xanthomonas sp. 3793]
MRSALARHLRPCRDALAYAHAAWQRNAAMRRWSAAATTHRHRAGVVATRTGAQRHRIGTSAVHAPCIVYLVVAAPELTPRSSMRSLLTPVGVSAPPALPVTTPEPCRTLRSNPSRARTPAGRGRCDGASMCMASGQPCNDATSHESNPRRDTSEKCSSQRRGGPPARHSGRTARQVDARHRQYASLTAARHR